MGDKQSSLSGIHYKTFSTNKKNDSRFLPALTGLRFFAIFHIFLFHLWSFYSQEKPDPRFNNLLQSFADLPPTFVTFLSHGWVSTSFFFLLSGFILAYLYWGLDGCLTTSKRRFWVARFARLYPIHLILLLVSILITSGFHFSQGLSFVDFILSLIANITLMQAWIPPYVPMWSWPTWTISALVFLYFLMPYLIKSLSMLSATQLKWLLFALPILSLIPTVIYAQFFPTGTDPGRNWQIFIGSTPLFWLAHFTAGMVLARVFKISRFDMSWKPRVSRWFAWGDAAFVAVIIIACLPGIEVEPFKFYLRHGLMMPLYMVLIIDLAKNQGLTARLFSLPGTRILGESSYSIFIWQNLIMALCVVSLIISPATGKHQLWAAPVLIILLSLFSTFFIEKPLAKKLSSKLSG